MIKGLTNQEYTIITNIFAPNIRKSKIYEENTDRTEGRHGQLYNGTRKLQYSLSVMDRATTQKTEKQIQDLNNPIEQLHLTNIQCTPPQNNNNKIHIFL